MHVLSKLIICYLRSRGHQYPNSGLKVDYIGNNVILLLVILEICAHTIGYLLVRATGMVPVQSKKDSVCHNTNQMSKNLNKRFFYTFLLRLSKDSDAVRNRWKLVDKVNRSSPFKLVH